MGKWNQLKKIVQRHRQKVPYSHTLSKSTIVRQYNLHGNYYLHAKQIIRSIMLLGRKQTFNGTLFRQKNSVIYFPFLINIKSPVCNIAYNWVVHGWGGGLRETTDVT
jgi:hypothetical protein